MNLEKILETVENPGRYTGGELHQARKENPEVTFVFSYPDTYEVGMSHLGGKIIYGLLNKRPDTFCKRCYAPWKDMEAAMRENGLPLFSLEDRQPVREADIWGFTLQYELSYTNVLNMLDLAGVPLKTCERDSTVPLIVAGGPCACHAEMLADFVDCFLLGDGEESLNELVDAYKAWRASGEDRHALLLRLSRLEGFYVPSLYRHERKDGRLNITPLEGAPARVKRRVVQDFEHAYIPTDPVVPYIEIIHDRIMLEIFRGCTRGCRFCQAGFLYRPVRERSMETLLKAARETADNTGYDELSLTSLSSGDYPCIRELTDRMNEQFRGERMDVSLPSLRIDSFDPAAVSSQMRKTSLTFAPEAGTQRLRNIINKNVSEEDLLRTIRGAFSAGFRAVKLYFMMGLPFETMEDVAGIADLAAKCTEVYREVYGNTKNMRITVSTSVFIPKPFTPFQWLPQDTEERVREKQHYLADLIRPMRGVEYKYHDSVTSRLEAACARGGRELCPVLLGAWKRGARMDAWGECFRQDAWEEAFAEAGLSIPDYAQRAFEETDTLPWDTVDVGVTKDYYRKEIARAREARTTHDCRKGCTGCGLMNICAGGKKQ